MTSQSPIEPQTPRDLLPTELQVEAHAEAAKAAMPASLPDRIFIASRSSLGADQPTIEPPVTLAGRIGHSRLVRLAAAMLLIASVTAIWLSRSPEQNHATLLVAEIEQDVTLWLEDEFDTDIGIGDELDALDAQFSTMSLEWDDSWIDSTIDALDEGSL